MDSQPCPKVIVVSRRLGSLCATKALLNSYGFDVATVTNENAAQAAARAVHYSGAIVCFHSFTGAERNRIAAILRRSIPGLPVVLTCPGCDGCVEETGRIGHLATTDWVSGLLPGGPQRG